MKIENLFPVPIIISSADDTKNEIDKEINSTIKEIYDNEKFEYLSYVNKKFKRTEHGLNYKIQSDIIEDFKMDNLKTKIQTTLNEYHKKIRWNTFLAEDNNVYSLENSWLNIIEPNTFSHEYHSHPQYDISGVYYHQITRETGGICFKNPNIMVENMSFPSGPISPQSIEYLPKNGDLYLFPSWLTHCTFNNNDTNDRISIAFNIKMIQDR